MPRGMEYVAQIMHLSEADSYSEPIRTVCVKLPPDANTCWNKCGKIQKTLFGANMGPNMWG